MTRFTYLPDPIDHPDLRGLTPDQLADLPLPRHEAPELPAEAPLPARSGPIAALRAVTENAHFPQRFLRRNRHRPAAC